MKVGQKLSAQGRKVGRPNIDRIGVRALGSSG